MATAYERVLAKYDWAKEHVRNFEKAVDKFRNDNPHTVDRETDTETGEYVYRVKSVPVIIDDLALKLGDALHNLRSVLDHLACALARGADGTIVCDHMSFPIFDTPEQFTAVYRTKIPGLREPLYEILAGIQPYKKGWGNNLWILHRLDIIDKHRMLLSVVSKKIGRRMTPSEKADFDAHRTIYGPRTHLVRQALSAAAEQWLPMQAGDELGRFPISKDYENVRYAFDVAINEVEVITGMPTFIFLSLVSSDILRIMERFEQWV